MKYGYISVSTKIQNEQRRILALNEFGVENEHIVICIFIL